MRQVFPVISFGACATETCESRRLPETTQRDVLAIDVLFDLAGIKNGDVDRFAER